MSFGERKRAWELDRIRVHSEVVYELDDILVTFGDTPGINHAPANNGFGDRGEAVGCYAIFRDRDGNIIHREIMSKDQIERVKKSSRNQDGLLWGTHWEEAWRKTTIRRGFKSVPTSPDLDLVLQATDEHYLIEGQSEVIREGADAIPEAPARVTGTYRRQRRQRAPAQVVDSMAQEQPAQTADTEQETVPAEPETIEGEAEVTDDAPPAEAEETPPRNRRRRKAAAGSGRSTPTPTCTSGQS